MGFIVRWIVKWLMGGFVGVFKTIQAVTQNSFDNTVIISLLNAFKMVGLPLIAVSMLVLILKSILALSNGEKVSIPEIAKRCIAGVIMYLYGTSIMQNLYLVMLDVCKKLINAILDISDVEWNSPLNALADGTELLTLVLLIVMLFYMFKTFLNLIERFWQIVIMLLMMYIYLPGYVAGDDESMFSWFKQTLAIILTQVFQTVLVVVGMTMYLSTGSINDFFLTVGALVASSKVEQLMDRYGMGVGGKLGGVARNGMSVAFYAKSIFR